MNKWTYESLFRKHLELTRCCREDLLTLNENISHWLFKARIKDLSDYISAWQLQSDEKYSGYSSDQDITFTSGSLDYHLYTPYEEFIFEMKDNDNDNEMKLKYFIFRRLFLNPLVVETWFSDQPIEKFNIYQTIEIYSNGYNISDYIFPFLDQTKQVLFLPSRVIIDHINITKEYITINKNKYNVSKVHHSIDKRRYDHVYKMYKNLCIEKDLIPIKGHGNELYLPCPDYNIVITTSPNGGLSRHKENIIPYLKLWKPLQRPANKVFTIKRCKLPTIILITMITLILIMWLLLTIQ